MGYSNYEFFRQISRYDRNFVRAEYKFLRKMGVDRIIAKGCMYRCANHLYLARINFGRDL